VTAFVLDAGALMAVDRSDRQVMALLRVASERELELRTNAMVVAQVWRGDNGRQAMLARLLHAVDIRSVDHDAGRRAGQLLGRAGTADAIDASVALLARSGDRVLTSDPSDLQHLVDAAGIAAVVVAC
jgi:hypothetical protein